jgi:cytochrome c oxidase cbb3-type subunit III
MRPSRPSISRLLLLLSLSFTGAAAPLGCQRKPTAPESQAVAPTPPADPGATRAAPQADTAEPSGPSEEVRLGAERYGRMCAVCHGASGEGYAADQAPAIGHPDFLGSASDDFLRRAIANGRTGTTMSAWSTIRGGPLPPDEVTAVVAFMRSWEKAPRLTLDERPVTGDIARGTALYVKTCQECHGPRGTGGPNIRIGDHELLRSASDGFLRQAIRKGRPPTPMPGYAETLGEDAVEDIVAYVRSLQLGPAPFEPPRASRPPPIPLGPVPLHAKGPQPKGFKAHPEMTSVDVVHEQLKRGARMAILDARAPSDYAHEHIAGAVSVPFYDPAPYLNKLPKNAWLICYCGCPHAESGILCQKLLENGFTKVSILSEGLGVWKAKGYPMRAGIAP